MLLGIPVSVIFARAARESAHITGVGLCNKKKKGWTPLIQG